MTQHDVRADYSIAAVSKLTGVSCHALRVWERRYGYPEPRRSSTNQRRYGSDQVLALRRLSDLARAGRPIGELISDLRSGRLKIVPAPEDVIADESSDVAGLLGALFAGDLATADALIARLSGRLAPAELIGQVLEPALVELGERWYRGAATVYQERLASGMILRAIGRLYQEARLANTRPAHLALAVAVQGERHEGGVLILATMLELAGWRALPLGVDLPVAELRAAAEALRPDAIGVSFVMSRSIEKRFRELGVIRGVPIFVGGRSVMNHKSLARRHGLTPLTGPIASALPRLIDQFATAPRDAPARRDPAQS